MSQYRAGLMAAFWTLTDIGRCFVPDPDKLILARATLSDLRVQIVDNVVVRLNADLVRRAADLLDRAAIMGSTGFGTSDRADARQFAEAMVEFQGEMENA